MMAHVVKNEEKADIYYLMSDQPDCCPKCQSRLDLLRIVHIDTERVFVNFCDHCQREIMIVED